MRIAVLFEYPTLWGGERSMLAAIDAITDRNIEIVAIAPPDGALANAIAERGVQHVALQTFDQTGTRRPRESVVPELQTVIDSLCPQIVHANSLSMSVLTGLLNSSVPRVGHLRDIMKLSKNVIRILNQNDHLIAVSHATRDHHVDQGLEPNKTHVIYNGVDQRQFRPASMGTCIRQELGLSKTTQLGITVGQIGLRKGLNTLVKAIELVAKEVADIHFLIVGQRTSMKAESVQYEHGLRESLEVSGLDHRVHWLGCRDDVPQLMNQSTMLVHCANQEPLGRVLLEAACCGLPIIATNVGGTAEIVSDGVTGRLVAKGDHLGIARAIQELVSDSNLREQFATAGMVRAAEVFDIGVAAQRLTDLWLSANHK
ncbi:MAG: glycosyltransferase family 4 protein [Planctomycetaceae bacterium]